MDGSSPGVDVAELEVVLGSDLDADVVDVPVLEAGVNRFFSISTTDAEDAYVLRCRDKLRETSYVNAVDVEYAVMEHLQNTAVSAPGPLWFCADESVLAEPFFVMTALDGEVVPFGSDLPDRDGHPDARTHRDRPRGRTRDHPRDGRRAGRCPGRPCRVRSPSSS